MHTDEHRWEAELHYITSRPYPLPKSRKEMANSAWFNMWPRQYWPYKELVAGDVLYWYERKQKSNVHLSQGIGLSE